MSAADASETVPLTAGFALPPGYLARLPENRHGMALGAHDSVRSGLVALRSNDGPILYICEQRYAFGGTNVLLASDIDLVHRRIPTSQRCKTFRRICSESVASDPDLHAVVQQSWAAAPQPQVIKGSYREVYLVPSGTENHIFTYRFLARCDLPPADLYPHGFQRVRVTEFSQLVRLREYGWIFASSDDPNASRMTDPAEAWESARPFDIVRSQEDLQTVMNRIDPIRGQVAWGHIQQVMGGGQVWLPWSKPCQTIITKPTDRWRAAIAIELAQQDLLEQREARNNLSCTLLIDVEVLDDPVVLAAAVSVVRTGRKEDLNLVVIGRPPDPIHGFLGFSIEESQGEWSFSPKGGAITTLTSAMTPELLLRGNTILTGG